MLGYFPINPVVNCVVKCLGTWRSPVPLHAVEELNGRKLGHKMYVIVYV